MYTSDITIDNVIDALANFIEPFVNGAEIIRAQVNRTAMPAGACVVLTELLQIDLSVPRTEYQPDDNTATIHGPAKIDIQIDFYGVQAGEFCKTVKSAFRSDWGFAHFPTNIKPLYTSDGLQSPLVTGEKQYESRWTLTATLQYNPTVAVLQEFADEAIPNQLIPADSN